MKWHKCSEILPKAATSEDRVAYMTYPNYRVLPWYDDNWWYYDKDLEKMRVVERKPTHWAKKPKPPVD